MSTAALSPLRFSFPSAATLPTSHPSKPTFPVFGSAPRRTGPRILGPPPPRAAISTSGHHQSSYDPELRKVLELATDSEFYFSPLLKSITSGADVDYAVIGEDLEEREDFLAALESRFLFLAADARSVLRGWRPSYRNVLLSVRKKLNIPCSSKLSTEDLEAEIFLHLLYDYSSEEFGSKSVWGSSKASDAESNLELGYDQQKIEALAASRVGSQELHSLIFKIAGKLSGKVCLEAANYQIKKEVLKKGGQLAAINLESRAALLAARQGLAGAASTYLGFRSMMSLLGPMMWGTLLADVVIQMLGTDYARIVRAIFAFAQIYRGCRCPAANSTSVPLPKLFDFSVDYPPKFALIRHQYMFCSVALRALQERIHMPDQILQELAQLQIFVVGRCLWPVYLLSEIQQGDEVTVCSVFGEKDWVFMINM
ncbi:hypothetical protein CRG98_026147 [Punica granatum]|uniref:Uncharacterized protein n=1 Tax=Punica granatum TaxID=22663 RepID=A0A2I0JB28_PUNGR|nr:hypothetical protein CRG98_026147 [Punica granatum]